MGNKNSISEVSHTTDREYDGGDAVLGLFTCGLSLLGGGSGEVSQHHVTLRDGDGNESEGSGSTYEQASANARSGLRR